MPTPDTEAPEQSLGDCAICMDTIVIDNPKKAKSIDELGIDLGAIPGRGGLLNAVQIRGGARKNYSLAPCHHLFVSDRDIQIILVQGLINYLSILSVLRE